jgi:diguanylate cyclase (GGDEF)-like protein
LSIVFACLIVVAMIAFARAPYLLRNVTIEERSGIIRIEKAQDLLSGVIDAQSAPRSTVDLSSLVERVVDPADDHIDLNPTYLDAVRGSWNAVRQHPGNREALADLGTATAELINKVSDAAQVSYDPDIDADNFGDAAAFQLPKAMENVAQAAAIANRPTNDLSVADRIAIGRNMAQAEVGWDGADNDYNIGVVAATTDVTALARAHDAGSAAFAALRARLDAIAEHPSAKDVAALPAEYRAFESAASTFAVALSEHVQDLIERRIERATARIVITCVWGIVALAIALLLVARISRGMLEREQRSLQIEKNRASALEAELARQRAERALVLNQAQFRTIFDGSPLGIATLDRDGALLERNPALFAMLDEFELFDEDFDASTYSKLLEGELRPPQFERRIVTADGSVRWLDMTVFPIRITDGDSVAAIAMIADVTERKSLSEQLRYEAKHDALTGLRSRGAFLEDVTAILSAHGTKRTRGQAVMLIDLDRFKLVNDSLGHAAGDDVLITIARRLLDVVRPSDVLARLHGDEFALYVTTSGEGELAAIAERAQHALRVPIVIEGQPVIVDSSIGICIAQPDVPADELLRNADTAMYNAKRMGRGRYVFFSGSMQEASTKWMRLASDMLLGLENDEFRVAYQPIVSLEDATIQGFEALLRWDHHELGPISPVDFIPIAEETGAIAQLGHFVLAEACRQVARWDWEHRKTHRVTMSVNLSAHQLQEYIVADVEQCIAEAGITGDRLILEITESALLESGPQISGILARLRATGARLSLDDFGTGYSSLRYLQQFPFDQLKIDRSFVCGPDGDIASEPIVRMLLNLADTLGLRAIAEGIESADQNAHLIALGCRYGQGFLFSQARTPADIKLDRPLAGAMRMRPPLERVAET